MNNCTCTDGGTYGTTLKNGQWYCTTCRGTLPAPMFTVEAVAVYDASTDTLTPVEDPTSPLYAGPCFRCGGAVPNEDNPGAYPGALSRYDDATYICSECGGLEALFQWFNKGQDLPNLHTPLFAAPVKGAETR